MTKVVRNLNPDYHTFSHFEFEQLFSYHGPKIQVCPIRSHDDNWRALLNKPTHIFWHALLSIHGSWLKLIFLFSDL